MYSIVSHAACALEICKKPSVQNQMLLRCFMFLLTSVFIVGKYVEGKRPWGHEGAKYDIALPSKSLVNAEQ